MTERGRCNGFCHLGGVETALAIAVMCFAVLASPAAAIEDTDLPSDPRVIEANALLSDESRRERAVALYREALADSPDDEMARMWLARVLAWDGRYDESLAEYRWFLAQQQPPPWAGVERAEVLSWAARYDDAEAAFDAILLETPDNARAARGLARVYKWTGRAAEAADLYERSLEFEGNTEARRELADLRSQQGGHSESDTRVFRDSDDFELTEFGVRGAMDINLRTRVIGRTNYTWVASQDASLDEDSAQGFDALAGVEHRIGKRWKARAEIGGRRWDVADDSFLARGELELKVNERIASGVSLEYGDFLATSHSLGALLESIDETSLRGWTWAQLAPQWGAYGYAQGSFISDSNRRVSGGGSIDFSPIPAWDMRLSLGFGLLSYTGNSDDYYDPDITADGGLTLAGSLPLHETVSLVASTTGGYGYAAQDGTTGEGFTFNIQGGPKISIGDFWLSATGSRSITRRSAEYRTWGVGVNLGLGF